MLAEALEALHRSDTEWRRAEALNAVGARLPREEARAVLAEALAAARGIYDGWRRAQTLSAVAQRLPGEEARAVLAEALAVAQGLGAERYFEFLRDQIKQWSQFAVAVGTTESNLLIQAFFPAPRARREWLLTVLCWFVPLIDRLSGTPALCELASAIRDTAEWWP